MHPQCRRRQPRHAGRERRTRSDEPPRLVRGPHAAATAPRPRPGATCPAPWRLHRGVPSLCMFLAWRPVWFLYRHFFLLVSINVVGPHRRAGTEWQQGCPKGWDVDAQPTEICAPWGALLAAPALTRSFLLQSASACTAKMGTLLVAVVVSLPACSGHVHRPASVATRVGTGSRVSGKGRGALTICYIRPGPDCVVLPCIDSRRSGLRQQ